MIHAGGDDFRLAVLVHDFLAFLTEDKGDKLNSSFGIGCVFGHCDPVYHGCTSFFNPFPRYFTSDFQRSGFVKYFDQAEDAFYTVYNVGTYTFAPFKVAWSHAKDFLKVAVVTKIDDSYLGNKAVVTDQNAMFIPCSSLEEAYYVSGAMNSSISVFLAASYTALSIVAHFLDNIKIPRYDSSSRISNELASLSKEAHLATATGDRSKLKDIEQSIDEVVARLRALTGDS